MDLKKLMAELGVTTKQIINTGNSDEEYKMLKRRSESTAFNIY